MTRYLNDDIKIVPTVRAAKIDEQDLLRKILELGGCDSIDLADYIDEAEHRRVIRDCFAEALYTIGLDVINIDMENCYTHPSDIWGICRDKNYLGVDTINGLTFFGGMIFGDWQFPLYVIIYWDGTHLRSYVPKRGNQVVLFENEWYALEHEDEDDSYVRKYGFADSSDDTIDFNWDAIWDDIFTYIQI